MKLGRRGFLLGTTALVASSSAVARVVVAPAPAIAMGELGRFGGVTFTSTKPLTVARLVEAREWFDRIAPTLERNWIAIMPSQYRDLLQPMSDEEWAKVEADLEEDDQ